MIITLNKETYYLPDFKPDKYTKLDNIRYALRIVEGKIYRSKFSNAWEHILEDTIDVFPHPHGTYAGKYSVVFVYDDMTVKQITYSGYIVYNRISPRCLAVVDAIDSKIILRTTWKIVKKKWINLLQD